MDNFIRWYDNVLSVDECDQLIKWFEFSSTKGLVHRRTSTDGLSIQDYQIPLDASRPDWAEHIYRNMSICLNKYSDDFTWLKGIDLISSICIIQSTKPLTGDGYHTWHCETTNYNTTDRMLAWTLYLNDVESGGETEFLYQGLRIEPKAGRFAVWPAGFTHVHRGNPPFNKTKYIITGWLTGKKEMPTFSVKSEI